MAAPTAFATQLETSPRFPTALQELIATTDRMPPETHALWSTRFEHVYGDLAGQRAVTLSQMAGRTSAADAGDRLHAALFGAQTYCALIADLIAVAAVRADSIDFLRSAARAPAKSFVAFLRDVSSGRVLSVNGVHGALAAFDFDWYAEALDTRGVQAVRTLVEGLASHWEAVEVSGQSLTSVSDMYTSLVPRNLLHVLGEVYTPTWLAQLLLEDAGWHPGQTLIDPFGGGGVFAVAGLGIAEAAGVNPLDVLPDLCLVDLNPIACAVARTNLLLALRPRLQDLGRGDIVLSVLSGDTLAPALVHARASSRQSLFPTSPEIAVDGELLPGWVTADGMANPGLISAALVRYGLRLPRWLPEPTLTLAGSNDELTARDRRQWEQLAILALRPADVVATNPPWVGWEYISRPYRTYLDPAWSTYGLFTAKGRDASFLKEDLSTLALITAWDHFLRDGGTSVAVLRANVMTSTLAAQGLRRLSVFATDTPLKLSRIRIFPDVRVFPSAQVEAATWMVTKGEPTSFPVSVSEIRRHPGRWQPNQHANWSDVCAHVTTTDAVAERVVSADTASRWLIGALECVTAARQLSGANPYVGRTGVFTGGANAVYYLERDVWDSKEVAPFFTNVTDRAKRDAPAVRVRIERELVYSVVRGRDLTRWASRAGGLLLLPHTRASKMRAIPPSELRSRYPHALAYFEQMRLILDSRKGFTQWDRAFREESYYAVQRVGEYTFAPYKVAWRYIASDFLVAVLGPDESGRPQLANDKVMFVGLSDADEAYYLCGVLSSDPIRWKIISYASGTQISANAIEPLGVPRYDRLNRLHAQISAACKMGHHSVASGRITHATHHLEVVNTAVSEMFDFSNRAMRQFRGELTTRYRTDWPSLRGDEFVTE